MDKHKLDMEFNKIFGGQSGLFRDKRPCDSQGSTQQDDFQQRTKRTSFAGASSDQPQLGNNGNTG